jgi:hypothetical protein
MTASISVGEGISSSEGPRSIKGLRITFNKSCSLWTDC